MEQDYLLMAQRHIGELYPTIVYRQPMLSELPKGAIIGTWAYSIQHDKRYILDKSREMAPGVMPMDVTRAWIKDTITLPIRARKEQLTQKNYPLPNFAHTGYWGDCAYVDIKGAYLNILRLGYNVEYLQGKYVGAAFAPVPQIVEKEKFCYAVAVAMSNSQRTNISVKGEDGIVTHKHFNAYSNPSLYKLASDTLSSIASEALRIFTNKIHYINTDGYIIESAFVDPLIRVISSWGFDARVKAQGETWVYGVGSWKCGSKRTRRYGENHLDFQSVMPDKDISLWLKRRVSKLNSCAILY